MNQFCLTCEDTFTSPLLNERKNGLGRNLLYTVLVFAVLCIASYLMKG